MRNNELIRAMAMIDDIADVVLSVPDGSGKEGHVVYWHTTEARKVRLMTGEYALVIEADRPLTKEELGT